MKRVLVALVVMSISVSAWAEESKPPAPTPETWATIRALSAETQAMEERFGRLNAELSLARQAFIERKSQWDAAVQDLATMMKMDVTKCVPDPISRTWVPRRPDIKECTIATKAP